MLSPQPLPQVRNLFHQTGHECLPLLQKKAKRRLKKRGLHIPLGGDSTVVNSLVLLDRPPGHQIPAFPLISWVILRQ